MKTLSEQVAKEIKTELENIPEKYQKNFNSTHEGLAVIQEEFEELKNEIFFGEKASKEQPVLNSELKMAKQFDHEINERNCFDIDKRDVIHRVRMRKEAIQLAAMCVRFIQELT